MNKKRSHTKVVYYNYVKEVQNQEICIIDFSY